METLKILQSMGLTIPSPAYMVGAVLFGIIGLWAWYYGKRVSLSRIRWVGLALMVYPYLVAATWLLYVVGLVLCMGLAVDVYHQRKKERNAGINSGNDSTAAS